MYLYHSSYTDSHTPDLGAPPPSNCMHSNYTDNNLPDFCPTAALASADAENERPNPKMYSCICDF